jgi:hypothetical protein
LLFLASSMRSISGQASSESFERPSTGMRAAGSALRVGGKKHYHASPVLRWLGEV